MARERLRDRRLEKRHGKLLSSLEKLEERMQKSSTPGPPPRPKKKRARMERRIWATLYGKGDRAWSFWMKEPTATGVDITPPWDERAHHFLVGEGEGAYNISFDENYGVRRVALYEGFPIPPVWLTPGGWVAPTMDEVEESLDSYITELEYQRAAEIEAAGEGWNQYVIMAIIMAVLTAAVSIVGFVTR